MEALLILGAAALALLAVAFASAMSAQARRPPLRTRQEEEMLAGDEEAFLESLKPSPASPIDRAAPVLEAGPVEAALREARMLEDERTERTVSEGRVIDGQVIDGQLVDGQVVDGQVIDGQVIDGKVVGGKVIEHEPGEDAASDKRLPPKADRPPEPRGGR